jgi:ABC-2 type transport system ATP-binding protein
MVFSPRIKRPVHALQGLELEVTAGSVVGLLGPNGCGKTTAISCLLGLLHPQQGRVFLWGKQVNGNAFRNPSPTFGVLLEDTKLPPFLSVKSALGVVCRMRGFRNRQLKEELSKIIRMTRIEDLLNRRISVLSKGQARRVGLAAALIGDPPLLILDEPSAGLDVSAREEFNELVRSLRDNRRTMIIASHLLSDIESTCTHIAIMQNGKIILYRDSETLLRQAREEKGEKDILVDQKHAASLEAMGIRFGPSKYPGQLLLSTEEAEHELLMKLAAAHIVPSKIEPKVNLVSIYLDLTGGDKQ